MSSDSDEDIDDSEEEISLPEFKKSDLLRIVEHSKIDCEGENFISTAASFTKGEKLGEGTYGVVFKGFSTKTGKTIALKRIKIGKDDEGIPITTLREICLLRKLVHPNIVHLQNLVNENGRLYLIFEYVPMDLKQYIKTHSGRSGDDQTTLKLEKIYEIFYQIVSGVLYCHKRRIIHRDLKPQNILIGKNDVVKVADFGLARSFTLPFSAYTHEIVTLYYRAPEVLLGSEMYACGVDVWSMGCIFAEMFTGKVLLKGDCEIDQLFKIFQLLGTPNDTRFPGLSHFPNFSFRFPLWPSTIDKTMEKTRIDEAGVECLKGMLTYNTAQRFSSNTVAMHRCFDIINKSKLAKN
ncbi:hypothetical protein GJ496_005828 [Pomphorhynchus laevis]|nr:hypothetical protein GJ496_007684 [Pomphorhynchus laevis]KAI0986614.1 hypothetical protein GJ496_005828 [Pomphorhynchus laevis]